jgi:hypothetical protein
MESIAVFILETNMAAVILDWAQLLTNPSAIAILEQGIIEDRETEVSA